MSFSLGRTSATMSLAFCFDSPKLPNSRMCPRSARQVGWSRVSRYYRFLSTPLTDFVTEPRANSFQRLPKAAAFVEARTLNQATAC